MAHGLRILLLVSVVCAALSLGNCCPKKVVPEVELRYPYKGCFIDREDDRDLENFGGFSNDLTKEDCSRRCTVVTEDTKAYQYFGMQDGNRCFCGNNFGKHGISSDVYCNVPCTGNRWESCGGFLYNSIYSVGEKPL